MSIILNSAKLLMLSEVSANEKLKDEAIEWMNGIDAKQWSTIEREIDRKITGAVVHEWGNVKQVIRMFFVDGMKAHATPDRFWRATTKAYQFYNAARAGKSLTSLAQGDINKVSSKNKTPYMMRQLSRIGD